jgi:hypothetical protein
LTRLEETIGGESALPYAWPLVQRVLLPASF